jgi:hypothetical protein
VSGDQLVGRLYAAARAGDISAFQHGVLALWGAVKEADAEQAGDVLERVLGLFELVPIAASAQLAVVAGALVEHGAPPDALVEVVGRGLGETLTEAGGFVDAWRHLFGSKVRLPEPDGEQELYDTSIAVLIRGRRWLRRRGLAEDEAIVRTGAWFSLAEWMVAANSLLGIRGVRAAFPRRDEAIQLVARLASARDDLACLTGMLAVLDGESLIVVHRTERRAYMVTISGVGDNFQLYTLLADALSGEPAEGLLAGIAPEPSWVAAATAGPVDAADRIEARFQLTDGYGQYIAVEGRPADIPIYGGWRVVVLDRTPYGRSWDVGRTYAGMVPEVRIDEILTPDAASRWLSNVAKPVPPAKRRPAHMHFGRRAGTLEITA